MKLLVFGVGVIFLCWVAYKGVAAMINDGEVKATKVDFDEITREEDSNAN